MAFLNAAVVISYSFPNEFRVIYLTSYNKSFIALAPSLNESLNTG